LLKKWGDDAPKFLPGDTVILAKNAERYRLQIRRFQDDNRESVRLSPEVRVVELERGVPTIPVETIEQFLSHPKLVTLEELENAGYIIASPKQTLLVTDGDQIYVRKLEEIYNQDEYIIVRLGQAYKNPENDNILAYEAIYLGDAKLKEWGDPSLLTITNAEREIRVGDRLLPIEKQIFYADVYPNPLEPHQVEDRLVPLEKQVFYEDFHPHSPEPYIVEGAKIIAVTEGTTQIGQYQVVVIDKGLDDGIEIGHTLNVMRSGHTIVDTIDEDAEEVKLPGQYAGTLLVFRPFDTVSYALVMKATFPIKLFDEVVAP
jgi:hypothetical protein